jgi:predicted RNase H-like nuclease (RuvC/YqgF family)
MNCGQQMEHSNKSEMQATPTYKQVSDALATLTQYQNDTCDYELVLAENKKLKAENEQLKESNSKKRKNLDAFKKIVEELEKEIEELKKENKDLHQGYLDLERDADYDAQDRHANIYHECRAEFEERIEQLQKRNNRIIELLFEDQVEELMRLDAEDSDPYKESDSEDE